MKKIRLVFLAAFLLFLDVATMPNVCAKPRYFITYDINVLNVKQTHDQFLNSYEKSLWPIERNYTLNEEDIEKIINKYFSNCVWVSKIDNIFTEKKLVLKNSDIISVLDQYKNEISFPKEITSSDCIIIHDTSDCIIIQDTSYWYKITININIDYELESLEQ